MPPVIGPAEVPAKQWKLSARKQMCSPHTEIMMVSPSKRKVRVEAEENKYAKKDFL